MGKARNRAERTGDMDVVIGTTKLVPDASGDMGVLSVVKESTESNEFTVIVKSAGSIDYKKGEIIVNTLNITSTVQPNNIIEIQAFPDSNDVIGLKDLYLSFLLQIVQ